MKLSKNINFISFIKNFGVHKPVLKWLVDHTKPYFASLILIIVLDLAASSIGIVMTLINRNIIDTATTGGDFTSSIILYVVILVGSLLVGAVSGILATIVNERFAFGIRIRVYELVMHACWDKISKFHSGDIITRLSSDVDIVANGIAEIIPSIISLGFRFILAFVTLAYFDIGIALFALILGPVTAIIGIVFGRMIKPLQEKLRQTESAYKSFMQESIANITVFKAFGAQQSATDRMAALRAERLKWTMKRQKVSAISSTLLSLSFQAGYMTAFIYSTIRLSRQLITYGTMSVFISMVSQIQSPIVGLSRMLPQVVSIFTSASRVIEVSDTQLENMEITELSPGAIGLEARDVCFAYDDDEILYNANLKIKPGEFVSMMGSSGIGKTTFVRLVMSYLSPDSGTMELFDIDGKSIFINAGAREYISYVPQGNTLVSGRIVDNIRLGNPDISEDEIWELLQVVSVDEFVRSTSHGLYTVIGERALGLSEGQAQRIAIARALAKKTPFLILDEATSALDEETEIAVLRHLREHVSGITCLLITHRTSVLKFCDRCIRIDKKKIVDDQMRFNGINELTRSDENPNSVERHGYL